MLIQNNIQVKTAPWHGLSLFFADTDPLQAVKGLAVAHVLARYGSKKPWLEDADLHTQMWAAHSALTGEAHRPETPFLPKELWLQAAAHSVGFYAGGALLQDILLKCATFSEDIQEKINRYSPHLVEQTPKSGGVGLQIAAFALKVWVENWQRKNTINTEEEKVFTAFIAALQGLELHDFLSLPEELKTVLRELHMCWILCLLGKQKGYGIQSLIAATDHVLKILEPFKAPRFDGFGKICLMPEAFTPLGYGKKAPAIFNNLAIENVWLKAMPVYLAGQLLQPEEQKALAAEREALNLGRILEDVFQLSAYQSAPSDGAFVPNTVSRKKLLEAIITEATNQF